MAKANPFRFSTKYQDEETDLLYFGYRYYNAGLGRWLGRDPKKERGGRNLYVFAANNPIGYCDPLGLSPLWYTHQIDPSEPDEPAHVAFYRNAIFLPVVYPQGGAKCACRGRTLGAATGSAWIDLSSNLGLQDVQPDYYNHPVIDWPLWNPRKRDIFAHPRYVGAGFTAIMEQTPGSAHCRRNFVWYNYIVRGWMWDKGDGRFASNQFLDSPGPMNHLPRNFSNTYKLVLKCEDPGWPVEELAHWYWGVEINIQPYLWAGTFYPPTADVGSIWPF